MREIRMIMEDLGPELLSMKQAGVDVDIVEDGETFEENAMIKASAIAQALREDGVQAVVLADDSGLEVDYLNKEPGVYSARYMGEDTSYTVKNANLIQRLEGVPDEERTARFVCVIAAVFPDGRKFATRAAIEGRIGYEERGQNGFGYDPIFYLPEYGKYSAELDPEEKNRISHRGKALEEMKKVLRQELMRILIVSDTHRKNENYMKVLQMVGRMDLVIHLGDIEGSEYTIQEAAGCPVEMVAGNNDFFSDLPSEKTLQIGKYCVMITHGHHYYINMGNEMLKREAIVQGADIVMYGHTHRPVIEVSDKITAVNPGSLSYPRQENRKPSYIIMEVDEHGKANFELRYVE